MESVYKSKKDCCGCTACEHVCPVDAIGMTVDEEGFLYPLIDQDRCIDCGKCVEVCAFQKGWDQSGNFNKPVVYAVKHKSVDVRMESTSGGAFTAISDLLLDEGGTVYGAAYEDQYTIIHKRAVDAAGRNGFRGSKYVQSDLRDVYGEVKEDLEKGRKVLFSGSGCQTAGLMRFLDKASVDRSNLVTVDFICHGTPSPKIFREYIEFVQEKRGKAVDRHFFRPKDAGWGHREKTVFADGTSDDKSSLSQAYKILFYSDLCLRPACHNCRYASTTRPSDLTIADFWGIGKSLPDFTDSRGVSAVLVNTLKGEAVFDGLRNQIEVAESSLEACAERQGNLSRPSRMSPKRDIFWQEYSSKGFLYILKKYSSYGFKRRMRLLIGLQCRKTRDIIKLYFERR